MGEMSDDWPPGPARGAAGQPGRRLRPAPRGARHRRRGRRRGHPPAGPAGPRPRRRPSPAGSSPTSRATRSGVPPNWSRRCRDGRPWSRWSPTAACPASPTPATGWSAPRSTPGCRSPPRPARAPSPPRWPCPGCPATGSASRASCPARPAAGAARLRALAAEERTLVLFEAPHRIAGTLADLAAAFGADRPAALCRELTKTYEEVRPPARSASWPTWAAEGEPRGEITLVVGGCAGGPAERARRRRPARRGGRAGGRRHCPAGTRSPRSPARTACAAATSTTVVHALSRGTRPGPALGRRGGRRALGGPAGHQAAAQEAGGDQQRAGHAGAPRRSGRPAVGQPGGPGPPDDRPPHSQHQQQAEQPAQVPAEPGVRVRGAGRRRRPSGPAPRRRRRSLGGHPADPDRRGPGTGRRPAVKSPRQRWVSPPPVQPAITTVPGAACPTASQSGSALTQAKKAATRPSTTQRGEPGQRVRRPGGGAGAGAAAGAASRRRGAAGSSCRSRGAVPVHLLDRRPEVGRRPSRRVGAGGRDRRVRGCVGRRRPGAAAASTGAPVVGSTSTVGGVTAAGRRSGGAGRWLRRRRGRRSVRRGAGTGARVGAGRRRGPADGRRWSGPVGCRVTAGHWTPGRATAVRRQLSPRVGRTIGSTAMSTSVRAAAAEPYWFAGRARAGH